MFCRNCGTENDDTAKFCRGCGQPIENDAATQEQSSAQDNAAQAEPQPAPAPQPGPYVQPEAQFNNASYGQPAQPQQNTGVTIAAFVMGIVSCVCCCGCTSLISVGLGVAALVMALSEKKKGLGTGLTTAAFILGIVGASLGALSLIMGLVTGSFAAMVEGCSRGDIDDIFNNYNFRNYWRY